VIRWLWLLVLVMWLVLLLHVLSSPRVGHLGRLPELDLLLLELDGNNVVDGGAGVTHGPTRTPLCEGICAAGLRHERLQGYQSPPSSRPPPMGNCHAVLEPDDLRSGRG